MYELLPALVSPDKLDLTSLLSHCCEVWAHNLRKWEEHLKTTKTGARKGAECVRSYTSECVCTCVLMQCVVVRRNAAFFQKRTD